jgi:hypothetical protein
MKQYKVLQVPLLPVFDLLYPCHWGPSITPGLRRKKERKKKSPRCGVQCPPDPDPVIYLAAGRIAAQVWILTKGAAGKLQSATDLEYNRRTSVVRRKNTTLVHLLPPGGNVMDALESPMTMAVDWVLQRSGSSRSYCSFLFARLGHAAQDGTKSHRSYTAADVSVQF